MVAHCRVIRLETSTLATKILSRLYMYDVCVYMGILVHTHNQRKRGLRVGGIWEGSLGRSWREEGRWGK